MAEVKIQEYDYHYETDPNEELPVQTPPKRPDIIRIPASPARRLKRVSRLEKIIGSILVVSMIYVRTDISQLEHDITQIEAETSQQKEEKVRLDQEKAELSKTERIKEIAEKQGLKIKDDNLRTVK